MKKRFAQRAAGDRLPFSKRGTMVAGIGIGAAIGALACLAITVLQEHFPIPVVLVNDMIFGPASLFNWFFILGDTGSPEQNEANVRSLAFLFNGLVGAIFGAVIGAIASAGRVRRDREQSVLGRE